MTKVTVKLKPLGPKPMFQDKFKVVDALAAFSEGKAVSRYLTLQLLEKGFLTVTEVKGEGRGRPRKEYALSGMARSRLALAKGWKRPVAS